MLVAALSSSSIVQVEENLSRYWRTTYDILVRPRGTRSPIEESYNLVEANTLTGINWGITFDQFEAIRDIPGVEIAAPIAMLAYLQMDVDDTTLTAPAATGVYAYETTLSINRGTNVGQKIMQSMHTLDRYPRRLRNNTSPVCSSTHHIFRLGHQPVPFLLTAQLTDLAGQEAAIGMSVEMVTRRIRSETSLFTTFQAVPIYLGNGLLIQ